MSALQNIPPFTLIEKIKYLFGYSRLVTAVYLEALLAHEKRAAKLKTYGDSGNGSSAQDMATIAHDSVSSSEWTDQNEIRQFGLTVAYALVEAALSEQPTLPSCFTADDLVLASDVLASEMSQAWR